MTKEEHNQILSDLKSCTSDADRISLLMQLETDYTTMLTNVDTITSKLTNAESEVVKFAKLNNELFLSNSAQDKVAEKTETVVTEEGATEEAPHKVTFESLESKF